MAPTRLTLIACLAALGLATTGARAAPRTQIVKGEASAKIVVYDSLCDEDNSLECLVLEIGCERPGDFTATVFDLQSRDAASVFAKGNGKGSVSVGGTGFVLQVVRVALSDYTFNWNVTATSLEKGREIWGAISTASEVQLQTGTKKAALRRSDAGEEAFRAVVAMCGAQGE